jgi:hypothetical protein
MRRCSRKFRNAVKRFRLTYPHCYTGKAAARHFLKTCYWKDGTVWFADFAAWRCSREDFDAWNSGRSSSQYRDVGVLLGDLSLITDNDSLLFLMTSVVHKQTLAERIRYPKNSFMNMNFSSTPLSESVYHSILAEHCLIGSFPEPERIDYEPFIRVAMKEFLIKFGHIDVSGMEQIMGRCERTTSHRDLFPPPSPYFHRYHPRKPRLRHSKPHQSVRRKSFLPMFR